jgi:ribosomal protein S8E
MSGKSVNVFEEMVREVQAMREAETQATTTGGSSTSRITEASRAPVIVSGSIDGSARTEGGVVTIFKLDRNKHFEFRTGVSKGVVIKVDYLHGELMRNGTSGVRVYSAGEMARRLSMGYHFETKHEVVHKSQ